MQAHLSKLVAALMVTSAAASAQHAVVEPLSQWTRPPKSPGGAPESMMTTYMYDDAMPEQGIGFNQFGTMAWLQYFDPVGGADTLTEISTMNGRSGSINGVAVGTIGVVALWDDPNNDGNPADAVLLTEKVWKVQFMNTDQFEPVQILPTVVSSRFFIGAYVPVNNTQFPAPLDTNTQSMGRAWLAFTAGPFNANCVSCSNSLVGLPQANPPIDGVLCLRAMGIGSAPTTFCTAKSTLVCGAASISFTGLPSVSKASGFRVRASPTRGCRAGLLLYSNQGQGPAVTFGGPGNGVLCLSASGLRRAGPIDSGGTNPFTCDGVMSIDMNAFNSLGWAATGCSPAPGQTNPAGFLNTAGTTVNAQMWGRDSTTTGQVISDGLNYTILP